MYITPSNTWGGQGLLGATDLDSVVQCVCVCVCVCVCCTFVEYVCVCDVCIINAGVSIRYCSFDGASENVWHVLVRSSVLQSWCSRCNYVYVHSIPVYRHILCCYFVMCVCACV